MTERFYTEASDQTILQFSKSVIAVRPQSVIIQYTSTGESFEKEYWVQLLDKIPKSTGCLIFAPFSKTQSEKLRAEIRELNELITSEQHSCQIVDVREEIQSGPHSCEAKSRTLASRQTCRVQSWVRQLQAKACDLDPRTFTDQYSTPANPAGSYIGN